MYICQVCTAMNVIATQYYEYSWNLIGAWEMYIHALVCPGHTGREKGEGDSLWMERWGQVYE